MYKLHLNDTFTYLKQRYRSLLKMYEPTQNFRPQKGDTKQINY
jgi:hypothetical protein